MVSKVEHPRRHDPRPDKSETAQDNTVRQAIPAIRGPFIFLRFIAARNNSLTTRYTGDNVITGLPRKRTGCEAFRRSAPLKSVRPLVSDLP